MVSGLFIVIFIFIAIISFAKITALYLMISLLISYLGISLLVTPFIRKATKERINLESEINKVMTESIRTIVDVHLSGSEKFFRKGIIKQVKLHFLSLESRNLSRVTTSSNRAIRNYPYFQLVFSLFFKK